MSTLAVMTTQLLKWMPKLMVYKSHGLQRGYQWWSGNSPLSRLTKQPAPHILFKVPHFTLIAHLWGSSYLLITIISEMRFWPRVKLKLARSGWPRSAGLQSSLTLFAAWRSMANGEERGGIPSPMCRKIPTAWKVCFSIQLWGKPSETVFITSQSTEAAPLPSTSLGGGRWDL